MDSIELCNLIRNAVPDKKDLKRAADIISNTQKEYYYTNNCCRTRDEERSVLANKQLKLIMDPAKFYRRAKVFLDNGITIKFSHTIYSYLSDLTAKTYIENSVMIAKENIKVMELINSL